MRIASMFVLIIAIFLLAGCDTGRPAETATPTVTAGPTDTPVLPTREPLPPTWTPGMPPTITPRPSATLEDLPTQPPTATMPPDCASFVADYNRIGERFVLGTAPTLYWSPATNASGYRVVLYDPQGETLWVVILDAGTTSYEFPLDLFANVTADTLRAGTPLVYGWEVTPVDDDLVRYCPPSGGELIPMPPEAG